MPRLGSYQTPQTPSTSETVQTVPEQITSETSIVEIVIRASACSLLSQLGGELGPSLTFFYDRRRPKNVIVSFALL